MNVPLKSFVKILMNVHFFSEQYFCSDIFRLRKTAWISCKPLCLFIYVFIYLFICVGKYRDLFMDYFNFASFSQRSGKNTIQHIFATNLTCLFIFAIVILEVKCVSCGNRPWMAEVGCNIDTETPCTAFRALESPVILSDLHILTQQPLKSFDRPLMRVSLYNSILW